MTFYQRMLMHRLLPGIHWLIAKYLATRLSSSLEKRPHNGMVLLRKWSPKISEVSSHGIQNNITHPLFQMENKLP